MGSDDMAAIVVYGALGIFLLLLAFRAIGDIQQAKERYLRDNDEDWDL